ncbi:hypothetical protein COLSTE_01628 [Collinsella stercoris DSM 13279]|uniref:Uncharacterized protein n=1 Tax=Collinsella stercoris DSM 13279 TaxID=445975 RepID=B6GC10_9ACTN|nr:hypothetical protein COLSTE_01628 [Collinsella stercoris DSM 13279]
MDTPNIHKPQIRDRHQSEVRQNNGDEDLRLAPVPNLRPTT